MDSNTFKALLFASLAGLCWGIGEIATKQVSASRLVGPFSVLLVRIVANVPAAVLAYWLAVHVFKTEPAQWWKAPTPVMLRLLLGTTLLAGFGGVMFFYLGLKFGEISLVKPVAFALAPAIAAVVGWLFLKESMSLQKGAGIALMLAGLVLIAAAPHGHADTKPGAATVRERTP
jgi:drug/metabolite transporter (DMT)-like permease